MKAVRKGGEEGGRMLCQWDAASRSGLCGRVRRTTTHSCQYATCCCLLQNHCIRFTGIRTKIYMYVNYFRILFLYMVADEYPGTLG